MSTDKMPFDDIVMLEVPGLTVRSDVEVYSSEKRYLNFVRDKSENEVHEESINNTESHTIDPFIDHIRMSKFGQDSETVLDNLRAMSWIDGTNSQIKKILKEEH